MELKLKRIYEGPNYTIGHLYINNVFFSDTLEDPVRILVDKNKDGDFDDPGEGKIYGNTAIPAGRYRVVLTMSNRFKKVLPLLINVPGYGGIRIHGVLPGVIALPKHTHGCLLIGRNTVKGGLSNT